VLVLNIFALTVLLGIAALAIDVSSWYQTKRHDQAVADAAALAGAQALPDDPAQATTLALGYANKNGFNTGWVGFWITGYQAQGNSGVVYGHFDRYIAQGLQSSHPNNQPDLGAPTIQLTK
jgi:uncharacterized membrane protein